ncbi:MAG: hypothetical protein HYR84_10145 [Planctomycetes bacterium]|nr:hypothetical protein [Planctomycetota bacterium]
MAPYEPKRALTAGVLAALPFALTAGILLGIGGEAAAYAFFALIAMPLVAGIVTAWFLHAVGAMVLTGVLSIFFTSAVLGIVGGIDNLAALSLLAAPLFAADAIGAIAGFLMRPFVRRRMSEPEA